MTNDQTIDDARFIAICEDLAREGKTSGPVWTSEFYQDAAIWERFLRDTLTLWNASASYHRMELPWAIRRCYRKQHEHKESNEIAARHLAAMGEKNDA